MSKSIYCEKQTLKFHYVYLITEITSNKKYIGSRTSDIDPKYDIGIKYFSSSSDKRFLARQKENRSGYEYKILSQHYSKKEAIDEEIRLHHLYEVGTNEEFYNKVKQSSNAFDTTGRVAVKDIFGKCFLVNVNDKRIISGELKHPSSGLIVVKDKFGNMSVINKNDPRYKSGEYVSNMKGLFHAKDKNGNSYTISKSDPRYLSGELFGATKGYKSSDETRRKISQNSSRHMAGKKHSKTSIKLMVDKKLGSKNPRARSISVNGMIFDTILEASKYHNTYPATVRRRLNSKKFDAWFYL